MWRLLPQPEGRQHVGTQFDRENLDDRKGQWNVKQVACDAMHNLRNVRREDAGEEFPQICEYRPALPNGLDNRREVVV